MRVGRTAASVLAVLVASAFGGATSPFTGGAYLAVGAAGGSVVVLGLVGAGSRRRAPRRLCWLGVALWAVPVLSFSTIEIVNDILGSTPAHPTLSSLMDTWLQPYALRALAWSVWLVAGLWLVAL